MKHNMSVFEPPSPRALGKCKHPMANQLLTKWLGIGRESLKPKASASIQSSALSTERQTERSLLRPVQTTLKNRIGFEDMALVSLAEQVPEV